MFCGEDQELPLKLRASPTSSTATQKVVLAQETADMKSEEAMGTGVDHELPSNVTALPPTATHNFVLAHETPASTTLALAALDLPLVGILLVASTRALATITTMTSAAELQSHHRLSF